MWYGGILDDVTEKDRIGQGSIEYDEIGYRTGHDRTGQDRTGQNKT